MMTMVMMQRLADTRQQQPIVNSATMTPQQQLSPPNLINDQDADADKRSENNNRLDQLDSVKYEGFRRLSPEVKQPLGVKIGPFSNDAFVIGQKRLSEVGANREQHFIQRNKKLRESCDSDSKMDMSSDRMENGDDFDRQSDVSEELNVDEVTDDVLSPVDLTRRQLSAVKHFPFSTQGSVFLPKSDLSALSVFATQAEHYALNQHAFKNVNMEKEPNENDRQMNGAESICSDVSRNSHSPRLSGSPKPDSPRSPTMPSLNPHRRLAFSVENILDPNKFTGRQGDGVSGQGRVSNSSAEPRGLRFVAGALPPAYWRPHFDVLDRDGSESGNFPTNYYSN